MCVSDDIFRDVACSWAVLDNAFLRKACEVRLTVNRSEGVVIVVGSLFQGGGDIEKGEMGWREMEVEMIREVMGICCGVACFWLDKVLKS